MGFWEFLYSNQLVQLNPKKRFAILKKQSDKNIFTILAIAQAIFLPARLPLYWLWGMNY